MLSMGSSAGFSLLVKQANQLSSDINNSRMQHRTFSNSGNRLLNNDLYRDDQQNDLQLSLGPSPEDQKKLDDMMHHARAQIDRPVSKILSASAFRDAGNTKSSLTMTTTAASDLHQQPRNQSRTLDKNHKLLQDFKKKVEQTQEHLLKSSSNFDMDGQISQKMHELLKDHIVSEKDRYIEQLKDQLDRQIQIQQEVVVQVERMER